MSVHPAGQISYLRAVPSVTAFSPADVLGALGIDCSGWLALSSDQKMNAVSRIARSGNKSLLSSWVASVNSYCGGQAGGYLGWLAANGIDCYRWLAMSDIERRMFVATRRFRNYGLSSSPQVTAFVSVMNGVCKVAAPNPATVVVKHRPAGQVVAAPPTSTTNAQGQLVDANGNLLTTPTGQPIQHHNRRHGFLMNLLVVGLMVGVPAYVGSYYGAKRATK